MTNSQSATPGPGPSPGPGPGLRVVRGEPTAAELAVVVAVLTARAAQARAGAAEVAAAPGHRGVSAWTDRSRTMTRRPAAGAGAWRSSAW